ncbi:MAG: hypothetical protein ACT4OT_16215 [Acidobacteriota bacterium]
MPRRERSHKGNSSGKSKPFRTSGGPAANNRLFRPNDVYACQKIYQEKSGLGYLLSRAQGTHAGNHSADAGDFG